MGRGDVNRISGSGIAHRHLYGGHGERHGYHRGWSQSFIRWFQPIVYAAAG